ncbi:MAG: AbrB/MazE/SpoVT family DNA-binding domain-containing protein [Verrucomicrobiota bacterium]
MKTHEISLARIGNSRGIRLPAQLIRKHGFDSGLLIQDRGDSVILTSKAAPAKKLSWEETAREMVAAKEDWSDWACTLADGLEDIPWEHAEDKSCAVREDPPQKRHAGKRKTA